MAIPIVEKIGQASKAAWPLVSAAVNASIRSAYEIAQISAEVQPKIEEYVAKGGGAPIRRRKVCDETVWVLANLGWLRTGPERDVILAAKVYADVARDPDASDDEYEQAADELIAVINGLPDYLTQPTTQEA